ncbi:hypothetical protein Tco_0511117 [Tanacetum coccineum]
MEKDSEIYKGKTERVKSIALKAKKESSDDKTSTSVSDDEKYAMSIRNFKKIFRRKGDLLANHERRRSHSGKGMTRKARVIGNTLDAVIQIISLANVQSLHETRIKKHLLRVIGVIWQSHFMRYVDMKSNKKELKKCIFDDPYVMTRVLVLEKPTIDTDLPDLEHTIPETYENTLPKNCAYIDAEPEVIHLILTGIGDDIYSTVDGCTTAKEIWIAIERLQHGKTLNKQDVKTNLFWEFGKFTSRDGESIESYYSRKPKRANDYAYHKEKMLLCKKAEKGVSLRAEQGGLTAKSGPTFDAEPLEKVQSDDDYNVFANEQQHSKKPKSLTDTYVVEKIDSNVIPNSSDMCDTEGKDDQNAKEYENEGCAC